MTELQLDIVFYVTLTFAFLYVLQLLNRVVRFINKANRKVFAQAEDLSKEVKKHQKKSEPSNTSDKALPVVFDDASVHPDDQLDIAGQLSELDLQVVEALKAENKVEARAEPAPVTSHLRIQDLARPNNVVSIKRKKPMAVRTGKTRIVNVPDILTDEAIQMLETPAQDRYPAARFASARTKPEKQRAKRREAIHAFVEDLPRKSVM